MTRTRKSVFDSLQSRLEGSVFLDLFCAAGVVGMEALSRGAAAAWFVEKDPRALACLRENLERLGLKSDVARVREQDALEFLEQGLSGLVPAPTIVYADPPYGGVGAEKVLAHFDTNPYPRLEILVVEHRRGALTGAVSLRLEKEKRFGDTVVSYYEPAGE